jgi:exopolysaccharide biosynthesis polyprenyl glycosylphosphotransferase
MPSSQPASQPEEINSPLPTSVLKPKAVASVPFQRGSKEDAPTGTSWSKRTFPRTQNALLALLFAGDVFFAFIALCISYWIRFHSPLRQLGPPPLEPDFTFAMYLPLMATDTLIMVACYAYSRLYDPRLLLRPLRSTESIMRATLLWFLVVVCAAFVLKLEPSVSRFFTFIVLITASVVMISWRYVFNRWLRLSRWRDRIMQRLVFIGWNMEAAHLARIITTDPGHSFGVCGVVNSNGKAPATNGEPVLGKLDELERLIDAHLIDTVVLVDLELPRDRVLEIAAICERRYVEFKIIPSFFQIFISGLQMQTIAGVPLLGVEALPLDNLINRLIKRVLDILGASIGLALSAPVLLVLAVLIKRESPGSIFYRQMRAGLRGEPFAIYKLRSMRLDAEHGTGPQWAVENDPRRLKIGAFMRRWNLDELPQFWNVLKGDMSLVGPRPERPELIKVFEKTIKNYHSRHEIRPGMTGWAQVNGLRGNTSLSERIRYDLHYIEHWSLFFDLQIIVLTFFRWKNAY